MLGYMWSNLAAAQLAGDERNAAEKQRDYIASKLNVRQVVFVNVAYDPDIRQIRNGERAGA